jgi:glycine betaine/proline transport system permease protein
VQIVPPLSWIAVIGVIALAGHFAGGWRLAALVAACFGFSPVRAVAERHGDAGLDRRRRAARRCLGLLLGIAATAGRTFEKALTPVLDLMQTTPVFAYLVPILFLFGFGPTAAIVATSSTPCRR